MTRLLKNLFIMMIIFHLSAQLGGCSWAPLAEHQRKGTSAEGLANKSQKSWISTGMAVGGVVLGPEAPLDPLCGIQAPFDEFDYREQSDTWAYYLFSALDKYSEEIAIFSWPTVRDQVPEQTIQKIHDIFAHMGALRPERLDPFRESFPLADFLVIARVDYNFLEHRTNQASGLYGSIGRTIEVTLECYDLHTGQAVWRSTKKKHKDGKKLGSVDDSATRARVDTSDEDSPYVGVAGTSVSAPTLDEMIAPSLDSLVKSMLKSADGYVHPKNESNDSRSP